MSDVDGAVSAGGNPALEVLEDTQACRLWAGGRGEEAPQPALLPAAMIAEMLAARPCHLRSVRCGAGGGGASGGAAAAAEVIDLCDSPVSAPEAPPRKRGRGEANPKGMCGDAAEPPAKMR